MWRSRTLFAVLLVAFCFTYSISTTPLWANSFLLGPKTYTRTTGHPNSYSERFSNCEAQSRYNLVLLNGNSDGSQRLNSVKVLLNGTEIIGSNELKKKVGKIDKPVSVKPENILEMRLASAPGGKLTVGVECVANCFEVRITPITSTITANQILVRGVMHTGSVNAGVTVNGFPALIHEKNWAYFVALEQGINHVVATATNDCGQTATATIDILANPPHSSILRLDTKPLQGLAPLTVLLKAQTQIVNPIYQWDFDGDGITDSSGIALGEIFHLYSQEGIYYPSVMVLDSQGEAHTEVTVVQVLTREKLDTMLQKKWLGMKDSLRRGDIERAVNFFSVDSRDRYRGIFNSVLSQLSDIVTGMGAIQFISLDNGVAKYRIQRQEAAGEITYYIFFVVDKDGIWRIKQF